MCTWLAEANVPPAVLKELARHSDLKTTMRHYVNVGQDAKRRAVEQVKPLRLVAS